MSTAASETSQILYPVSITMLASVTHTNYNLHKAVKTMSLGQLMWHQWHHNCFLNVRQTWAEAVPLTVALWFKWWTIDCPLCVKLLATEPAQMKWFQLHSQTGFIFDLCKNAKHNVLYLIPYQPGCVQACAAQRVTTTAHRICMFRQDMDCTTNFSEVGQKRNSTEL